MTHLDISEGLARRLQHLAQQQNRTVEELLSEVASQQEKQADPELVRQFRAKLYRMARDYWQQVGDTARLALTDTELDEQFWLIDHEGIPRLKADMGQVELPPDPLEAFVGLFADSEITNASITVREKKEQLYGKKDGRPD